ncbi:leucine-rich repeat domain-containing protein [Candidatus Parcubacteria bacterium]|nr:MAG: leucine-rich repeat domain-containing protein [Candidatus Parcubacteria bacterium]
MDNQFNPQNQLGQTLGERVLEEQVSYPQPSMPGLQENVKVEQSHGGGGHFKHKIKKNIRKVFIVLGFLLAILVLFVAYKVYDENRNAEAVPCTDPKVYTDLKDALNNANKVCILNIKGVSSLPPEIGKLKRVTSITLEGNQIPELPKEIVQLRNLQQLNLRYNKLTKLPKGFSKLNNLTNLNLEGNQLGNPPEEIWELKNLKSLNLALNKMTVLSPKVGSLTSLAELQLWGNQITEVPPAIGNLTGLIILNMDGNALTKLPPEVTKLSTLRELYIGSNRIKMEERKKIKEWLPRTVIY